MNSTKSTFNTSTFIFS